MGGCADHVEHDAADTHSLVALSRLFEFHFENIEGLVYQFLTELLDESTHATKSHFLQLWIRSLDDIEDLLDEGANDLTQDEELIIDDTLPNLASL